jgi:endo-1,4-beta-xylanase
MKVTLFVFALLSFLSCVSTVKKTQTTNDNQEPPVTTAPIALYKAYAAYFPIGTAINPEADLVSAQRKEFITQQYNSVTAENQMKPKQIHPKENVFNWEPADKIVAFAKENKMKVRGHALVWQQNVPQWMCVIDGKLVSKEMLFAKMKSHINAVVNRYKNDVYCWDVVNEAISDKEDEFFRANDTLNLIAGEEYIEMAFRFAREADPKAILYYNDYRFSNPVKRKKIYDLLKRLKEKGVPIDGVGLQSHYTPNEITRGYLQETFDMFSKIGLKIQITELDVSVYNYRDKSHLDASKTDDLYTDARKKTQEDFYEMLFELYRKNKDKITAVTFWGASDLRKNYRTIRIGKMDYPFFFDENMQPKNVFFRVTKF